MTVTAPGATATPREIVYQMTTSRLVSHLIIDKINCRASIAGFYVCHGLAVGGEDCRSHVAADFGPFVVLLGQSGADEADDSIAGRGKMPTTSVQGAVGMATVGVCGQGWPSPAHRAANMGDRDAVVVVQADADQPLARQPTPMLFSGTHVRRGWAASLVHLPCNGTVALILAAELTLSSLAAVLNLTPVAPADAEPVIATSAPIVPDAGLSEVTTGAASARRDIGTSFQIRP